MIAIDPDPMLVEVARRRALGDAGRRIFFKSDSAESLSFGDGVFDLVIGNLALGAFEQRDLALREMHRVLDEGGRLLLTHAIDGTFEEVLDMFRESALRRDDKELASRTERMAAQYPTVERLSAMVTAAGFRMCASRRSVSISVSSRRPRSSPTR